MKLAYWMYAGPAHIGTLRVASSFKNVHAIMHAPLGDDYFNVMRSMLERERDFTPVTASIVDRHVLAKGSQEKVVENITRKDKEECPDLIILTPTCTSSILQEDLNNFVNRAALDSKSDVILADVNHYRVNEIQAADRTLEQIVRFYLEKEKKNNDFNFPVLGANAPVSNTNSLLEKTKKPSVNIIGIFTLGFHNQHDCRELRRLLNNLGIEINEIVPEGGCVHNLKNLPKAWFNLIPYREVGLMTAQYLQKEFKMPFVATTPMGIIDTALCIREIQNILNECANQMGLTESNKAYCNFENYIENETKFISQAAWFSRSIDCQNLIGKKAIVFGDATHAAGITKILSREMGIRVVCSGTYCKHDSDWFREQVFGFCDQILITDDHTQVGDIIAKLEPSAIFGTQMERHIGKRLDIPCGVISAPVHIQNFPLSYRPFLGYEGTNQIADLVYNSFSLGMEDHLLEIFSGHDTKEPITKGISTDNELNWTSEALSELSSVPGFVRGKVKRNTEKFARQKNISIINLEVLFAAKEALSV
uniref:light-independent protochlorophyllide reductase subunit B n=1 Tax=Chlamydomonas chlamydogama TaxID=225041 RepID=UPI00226D3C5A|nr:light-independent protochlorophyllide reductase subunit B [Chlamydomonas chlamydogama]UZA61912.1 light-independent protochlorophyllide reductase subunit B [Chlamydomonas chlamydogama]